MAEAPSAVLGLFPTAQAILDAVPAVRAGGFAALEAYTPYPVHGMEEALGQKRSPLGVMVLVMALLGAAVAMGFQWWTSAVDYPIETGGKALFAWQSFVPIMFEVTVLFATFTAGLGMLFLLNRLPFFGHPVLHSRAIGEITRDRFALVLEPVGGVLDEEAARRALLDAGATAVELLPAQEPHAAWPPRLWLRVALGIAAACVLSGTLAFWAIKLFPVLPPMVHMQEQPKLNPFKPSGLFRDGLGMRLPVAGTVARGHLPLSFKTPEEAGAVLANPLPRSREVLEEGRAVYNAHCAVCHGAVGDGTATLSSAYGAKPANLHSQSIRDYPDGRLYGVVALGKNAMPSYAADLTEEERWTVVHYVRALQRAQNAREEDLR